MTSLWRGSVWQKGRLVSGLVLFAFAATHFINHALGLVSLEAMTAFDDWRFAVNRSWPGTVILGGALVTHVALSIGKLVMRRSLRMPPWEAIQVGLGLAIPLLLLPHVVNTRIAQTFFGVYDTYSYELARIWPATIVQQTVLLVFVWVHGCMGLHYWLRLSKVYRACVPVVFALAVLLPFAAFLGVSVQGRALQAVVADPARFESLKAATHWPAPPDQARLVALREGAVKVFYGGLGLAALVVICRLLLRRHGRGLSVTYAGGSRVPVLPGDTLLDVSRHNGIAHLSVCGGRGRCSTCRVMVLDGEHHLDPPDTLELETLGSIQAGPRVRLACQARVRGDVTIMPLLKSDQAVAFLPPITAPAAGAVERDLSVLFVDMRGFTTMTESKLAFDVVFILNQFFNTVGKPIYDMGGVITNYAGDGLIAMFADTRGIAPACRSALLAACEIDRAIAGLNARLANDLHQPMRIAMGLHAGPHIVGQIGYKDAVSQSVIGLAMNIASRMEALAKQAGVQLAVSTTVTGHAGLDTTALRVEEAEVRGLRTPLGVVLVDQARQLEPLLRRATDPAGTPSRFVGRTGKAAPSASVRSAP